MKLHEKIKNHYKEKYASSPIEISNEEIDFIIKHECKCDNCGKSIFEMENYPETRDDKLLCDDCYDELCSLAKECMKYVKCDTARISKPCDKMFLIIGFNRNTKDDESTITIKNNQRIDYDYVQELVVASGYTKEELIESTKEYQRLCGITWEQYFKELTQKK